MNKEVLNRVLNLVQLRLGDMANVDMYTHDEVLWGARTTRWEESCDERTRLIFDFDTTACHHDIPEALEKLEALLREGA